MTAQFKYNPYLHWFAAFTALCTLALIGVGGLVTSHGVGMAVPDWPNTYGYNMFFFPLSQWVGGVFYEHTHRLVASAVGLLTLLLALWLYGHNARPLMRWLGAALSLGGIISAVTMPKRWQDGLVVLLTGVGMLSLSFFWPKVSPTPRWLRRLGSIAFVAVVLQGVLGGLRVTEHKDEIGIFHATLAQLFFVLVCSIALFTSRGWATGTLGTRRQDELRPVRRGVLSTLILTTSLILVQLTLGATMRHEHAGLAIPDFPLAYGKLWPATDPASVALYNQRRLEVTALNPITGSQIVLQMTHRIVAVAILAAVVFSVVQLVKTFSANNSITKFGYFWVALILTQAVLGMATIWSNKAADIATAHVFGGALSLAVGAILSILSARALAGPDGTRELSADVAGAVRPPVEI